MTVVAEDRTAAATQARRDATARALERVDQALRQLRRERARITVAGVARRADVSRTFLYQNDRARQLLDAASTKDQVQSGGTVAADATWHERALNAEHELRRAHDEIVLQRRRIGELLGQIRDLEHDLPPDGVQHLISENHTLNAQAQQASHLIRQLENRLAGARDNNRFLDKRLADLEAEVVDLHRLETGGDADESS